MHRPDPSSRFRGFRGNLPGFAVPHLRRSVASFLWFLAVASGLSAQPPAPGEIVVRAYTFKYQKASEALAMVYPLLSPRGTVELQPAGNTLVVRDTQEYVQRIVPSLRAFDQPARPLRLEVLVVRASRTTVSPHVQHSDLPDWLTKRLRDLLAYDVFERQAQAQLGGKEGQWVVYELGPDYRVSFRFGKVGDDGRVKLSGFRIARRSERGETNLLQANVTLSLDQTTSLGLANSEGSQAALMLVLTLRDATPTARQK
jgi:hypothetical protein